MAFNEEDFFDAISIIIDSKLQKVVSSIDTTYECTIIAVLDQNNGSYMVSHQNSTFKVFVADANIKYSLNDTVYVIVPNNNFDNTKYILGKKDATSLNISANPLDTIVKSSLDWSELYSYPTDNLLLLLTKNGLKTYREIDLDVDYKGFSAVAENQSQFLIKGSFFSCLGSSNSTGNYGLKIVFNGLNSKQEPVQLEYSFDCSNFSGNPYNYCLGSDQYIVYNIPEEYTVVGIDRIFLFQDGNFDFEIEDPYVRIDALELAFIAGIEPRNEAISAIITSNKDCLQNDSLTLSAAVAKEGTSIPDSDYQIYWFIQDSNINSIDSIGYSIYGGYGWSLLEGSESSLTINYYKDYLRNKYKAVIVYDNNTYQSNILIILNTADEISYKFNYSIVNDEIFLSLDTENEIAWLKLDSNNQNRIEDLIYTGNTITDNLSKVLDKASYFCTVYNSEKLPILTLEKTIQTNANIEQGYTNFVGDLIHLYDENGDLNPDEIDKIYSIDAVLGSGVEDLVLNGSWQTGNEAGFPHSIENSMITIQGVNNNRLYYTIDSKYDITKSNNTLTYLLNGEIYSQNILFLKTGDPGTNGTDYTARLVLDSTSIDHFYSDGSEWNGTVTLIPKVYKDGEEYSDFKVKQWLIPQINNQDKSMITFKDNNISLKILYYKLDKDYKVLSFDNSNDWVFTKIVADVFSNSTNFYYKWNFNGEEILTSSLTYIFNKDIESVLKCQIYENGTNSILKTFVKTITKDFVEKIISRDESTEYGYTKNNYQNIPSENLTVTINGWEPNNYNNVIEAEIAITDTYSIYAFYAIPISFGSEDIQFTSIVDKIVYGTDGTAPKYNSVPLAVNVENVQYKVLGQGKIENNVYIPPDKFLYEAGMPAIMAYTEDSFCIYPIITILNAYGQSWLNAWDGTSVTVNEDDGYILAPQIGAGKKEEDNSFTGVVMGLYDQRVGLYGFSFGTASFGLLEDGTAFFGKSGSGQILFDGRGGTIQSGNFQKDELVLSGMRIDLDDGIIETPNFSIDSEGNAIFSGKITSKEGLIGGFSIGESFLSTGDVGSLEGDISLTEFVYLGEDGINLGNNFIVTKEGNLIANKVTLRGGLIQSDNFSNIDGNVIGTQIDLNDGSILTKYFKIDSAGNITAEDISLTGGVIQSSNFSDQSGVVTGTKIDLSDGSISTKYFKIDSNGNVTASGSISANSISVPNFTANINEVLIGGFNVDYYEDHHYLSTDAIVSYDACTAGNVYLGTDGIALGGKTFINNEGDVNIVGGQIHSDDFGREYFYAANPGNRNYRVISGIQIDLERGDILSRAFITDTANKSIKVIGEFDSQFSENSFHCEYNLSEINLNTFYILKYELVQIPPFPSEPGGPEYYDWKRVFRLNTDLFSETKSYWVYDSVNGTVQDQESGLWYREVRIYTASLYYYYNGSSYVLDTNASFTPGRDYFDVAITQTQTRITSNLISIGEMETLSGSYMGLPAYLELETGFQEFENYYCTARIAGGTEGGDGGDLLIYSGHLMLDGINGLELFGYWINLYPNDCIFISPKNAGYAGQLRINPPSGESGLGFYTGDTAHWVIGKGCGGSGDDFGVWSSQGSRLCLRINPSGNLDVSGSLITRSAIEIYPGSSSAGHGGFIDFHYNNSSSDYTSRIIEWSDSLQFTSDKAIRLLSANYGIQVNYNGGWPLVVPMKGNSGVTNRIDLGNNEYRFKNIYLNNAPNVSSDQRLKRDIIKIDNKESYSFISLLDIISFNYLIDEDDAKKRIGVLANQMEEVNFDYAQYFVDNDGAEERLLSLRSSDLVFPLIQSVQYLAKKEEKDFNMLQEKYEELQQQYKELLEIVDSL